MFLRLFSFMVLLMLPLAAHAHDKLHVVASFSVIGDLVHQVAGNDVEVRTLVGANGNVHEYEPTPADAKAIAGANLVFINGLGLEGWGERLITSSGYKGPIIVVTQGITPLEQHGAPDPHAWQNVENAKIYIVNIRDALVKADAVHKSDYDANAAAYIIRLDALDRWVKQEISGVNPDKRKVISMHDSFQYFAARYAVAFIAPLGMSMESEASASDLAHIIDEVRKSHITAVFLENMTDSRLIKQLQSDAHVQIGGTLYSDALSAPDGPAPDYIAMVRHNVSELVAAMKVNSSNKAAVNY